MSVEWLGLAKLAQPLWSFYHRIVGKRPHLNFEPGDDGVKLRVTNPRDQTIIVEDIRATPSILSFSNGQEPDDLARAIIAQQRIPDEDALGVVEPNTSAVLSVVTFDPFGNSPPELVIKVKLRWRVATRGVFSQSSITRKISIRDVRALQRATEQRAPRITILR